MWIYLQGDANLTNSFRMIAKLVVHDTEQVAALEMIRRSFRDPSVHLPGVGQSSAAMKRQRAVECGRHIDWGAARIIETPG